MVSPGGSNVNRNKSCLAFLALGVLIVSPVGAIVNFNTVKIVEGNPIPPPVPPVMVAEGNPLPPLPPTMVAEGNPLPPLPPTIVAEGNPLPPLPPTIVAEGNPLPPLPPTIVAEGNPLPPLPPKTKLAVFLA
jgi:hypothetical protein